MPSPRCSRPPGNLPSPNSGLLPSLLQRLGGQRAHGRFQRVVTLDPNVAPWLRSSFITSRNYGCEAYALKGRVVELKVEEDGDLHIALHDVTGDKPGVVVCEVPAKPQWCEIRTTVFSWTPTRFPFHTGSAKKLTFGQSPIITVIGKAFWDVGHAPKDQSNRRKYMPDYAVWGNSSGDETRC